MGACSSSVGSEGETEHQSDSDKYSHIPKVDSKAGSLKSAREEPKEEKVKDVGSSAHNEATKEPASERSDESKVLKEKVSAVVTAIDLDKSINVSSSSIKGRKGSGLQQPPLFSAHNNSHLGLGPGEMEALPYEAVSPSMNLSSSNAKTRYPLALQAPSPSFSSPEILPLRSSNNADKLVHELIQGSAPLFELALSPIGASKVDRAKESEEKDEDTMQHAIQKGKEKARRGFKETKEEKKKVLEKGKGGSRGWSAVRGAVKQSSESSAPARPTSLKVGADLSTAVKQEQQPGAKNSASFSRLLQPLKRHRLAMNVNAAAPAGKRE